jgi:CheY-like chemotaxis protein
MRNPYALIVEDDRDIVALFRHVLDIAGYHTEIVLDGKEAMERILTSHPDIVLLDLQLPGMSGVDILKRMKTDESLMTIPVVVITAYAYYMDQLPVEPDLFLMKPVDINQLSRLVQRLQATQGTMNEPAHDEVTGLYTFSFFKVRMAFSLERIKQTSFRRFGVLFADVIPYETIQSSMPDADRRTFYRQLATHFKSTLRPTDTMAWSAETGTFFTLIEDIPSPEVPLKIAVRVRDGWKRYLESQSIGAELRSNVGILLCDSDYEAIEGIMKDVYQARMLLHEGIYTNPSIIDRDMLRPRKS